MRFRASQFSVSACVCVWNPAICLQAKWLNAGALVPRSPPQVRGALEVIKSLCRLFSSNSAIKRHATSHRPSLSHALMLAPKVIRSSPNKKHFVAKEECLPTIGPDGTEVLVAFKLHDSNLVFLERWASVILGRHTRPNNTRIP